MPRPSPNYVLNPIWDDHKKVKSRSETVLLWYRKYFGESIPKDKQYWTMCGAYLDAESEGEFQQICSAGLIKPEQFYGVDTESKIIEKNKKILPNIKWINGDFRETMLDYSIEENFNPAIVNYDGVMQKKFGAEYLRKIMKLIDANVNDKMLLLANFVMKSPYRKSEVTKAEDIIRDLKMIYVFPNHWSICPDCYYYNGSGARSHSLMCTFGFIKKTHTTNKYSIRNLILKNK